MLNSVDQDEAQAAVALLEDAVTALITAARDNPCGAAVLELLRGLEAGRNRLAVAEHALVAEAEMQGLAHEHACASTASWLSQLLRINPGDAQTRVRAAGELGPRRGLTG